MHVGCVAMFVEVEQVAARLDASAAVCGFPFGQTWGVVACILVVCHQAQACAAWWPAHLLHAMVIHIRYTHDVRRLRHLEGVLLCGVVVKG